MDSLIERLKDAAGRATPGPWDAIGEEVGPHDSLMVIARVTTYERKTEANAAYIALASPSNILTLVAALQASAQREKVLREALEPFAKAAPSISAEVSDADVVASTRSYYGNVVRSLYAGDFRRASRALSSVQPEPARNGS